MAMDPEYARKKALMDWIVAKLAGKDLPKPVVPADNVAPQDKTAVELPPKGVSFHKWSYDIDSDKELGRFLNDLRADPLMEPHFFDRMSEIKGWADQGHGGSKNTHQSVVDVFKGEDPMRLRQEGYQKDKKLREMYGIED